LPPPTIPYFNRATFVKGLCPSIIRDLLLGAVLAARRTALIIIERSLFFKEKRFAFFQWAVISKKESRPRFPVRFFTPSLRRPARRR
jgi:hypothetical protein